MRESKGSHLPNSRREGRGHSEGHLGRRYDDLRSSDVWSSTRGYAADAVSSRASSVNVYRVRVAVASRPETAAVQAVVMVVAKSPKDVPRIFFSAQPAWQGAGLEIQATYEGTEKLWPVRIGTGEFRRYLCAECPRREDVHSFLLAMLPVDDPWRQDVVNEWYEVSPAIKRNKEGVF